MIKNFRKSIYIFLGFIALLLGLIGVVFPLLPTVPLFLIASYFFVKSSKKIHDWFLKTNVYKNNLESFSKGNGMTIKVKVKIMVVVTLDMVVGFVMMKGIFIGRIVLFIVWIFHALYFVFKIKTISS